ncbi:hypothetical protein HPB50_000701 [Hyalomma asiaticum]|uniref:Uncharacterized protein n=1 Tax=Hyalomma asiaticum TaxID=266040 RepID=A0ACB7SJG5_HYAAI|nr:hypothetical protein HPB50_000701 [Hyalomma asiaticum]
MIRIWNRATTSQKMLVQPRHPVHAAPEAREGDLTPTKAATSNAPARRREGDRYATQSIVTRLSLSRRVHASARQHEQAAATEQLRTPRESQSIVPQRLQRSRTPADRRPWSQTARRARDAFVPRYSS